MHRIACDVCGTAFEAKRDHAKHCSPACARAAYAKKYLPVVEEVVRFLLRERRRLKNLLPTGTRRRAGKRR